MNTEEARAMLPLYADGLLDEKNTEQLEAVLAATPELRDELARLQEENALLTEALAPLNPSRSSRMKLSEAMEEVQRQADFVARNLPGVHWRIFRYLFAVLTILTAIFVATHYPLPNREYDENAATHTYQISPPPKDDSGLRLYAFPMVNRFATLTVLLLPLVIGVLFLIGAEFLAYAETWLAARILGKRVERTRLQVVAMEIFGITSILIAAILYYFMLRT